MKKPGIPSTRAKHILKKETIWLSTFYWSLYFPWGSVLI